MSQQDNDTIPWVKIAGGFVAFLLLMWVIGWLGLFGDSALGIWYTNTFGVKQADAERKVYTHTQSYVQGNNRRLQTLCSQRDEAEDKRMLNDVISHEFADVNTADVPDYLRGCLAEARGQ